MNLSRNLKWLLLSCLLFWVAVSVANADEYTIGPGDVLQISFWQDPELDQTVTVRRDGKITVSIIGETTAAGLTPAELAQKIGDRSNYYNRSISQATVTVLAYNSQKVFINGQVLNPGAYAFEEFPDVWTLIKEAGGVTDMADLSRVTLIRGSKDAGRIETVNIDELVAKGQLDEIPRLNSGDIVEVPSMPGGIHGAGLPKAGYERRNVVYVTGAVGRAGAITLEQGMDVLDAIVMAGGSLSEANLKKVKVISKHEGYSSVMSINLEKYASSGTPRRYILKQEDTVVLPFRESGWWGVGWGTFRDLIAVTASVVSTYMLIDRLNDNNEDE